MVFENSQPTFESLFLERKQFDANSCGLCLVARIYLINLPEISDRQCFRHRLQFVGSKSYYPKSGMLVLVVFY